MVRAGREGGQSTWIPLAERRGGGRMKREQWRRLMADFTVLVSQCGLTGPVRTGSSVKSHTLLLSEEDTHTAVSYENEPPVFVSLV